MIAWGRHGSQSHWRVSFSSATTSRLSFLIAAFNSDLFLAFFLFGFWTEASAALALAAGLGSEALAALEAVVEAAVEALPVLAAVALAFGGA